MTMQTSAFQTRFWLTSLVIVFLVLWLLRPVLPPFLVGMAVAYFLNPVVDRLVRHNVPRWLGALIVLAGFALAISFLLLLIMPLIEHQIGALIAAIPAYSELARSHLLPRIETWLNGFSPDDVEKIRDAATQYAGEAAGLAGKALRNLVTSGIALIDIVALLIITPIVAFYMMRDWPAVTHAIDQLIPRRHYDVVRQELHEIDVSLSGFVRGQALVCLGLGCFYSIGLTIVGLPYGAAIGVVAGFMSFIPYVGTLFAWIASLILAFVQFNSPERIGFVIGVLLLGHIMESYVLTPRLVGSRVGLHPVWILFAIIAGGSLMGFSGVIVAVPLAAVLGVLIRFGVRQYRKSAVYQEPPLSSP